MHDKTEKPSKPLKTPDPQLTEAAAHGDPMAAALAAEVAKEEAHPATKTVMMRRAVEAAAKPALKASSPTLETVARNLLEHGSHAPACRSHEAGGVCNCDWAWVTAEARAVLGVV